MNWLNLALVSGPADTVVTLSEVKAHLRIAHSDEDAMLTNLIDVATSYIEGPNGCGIALLTQTWRASFNAFPCGPLTLSLGPVSEIVSVTYLGGDGTPVVCDPAIYEVDLDQDPCRIWRAPQASWPTITARPGAVKVTFKTGFGSDPEDVPAILRQAVLLLIGHYYNNANGVEDKPMSEIPHGIESILSRYRSVALN